MKTRSCTTCWDSSAGGRPNPLRTTDRRSSRHEKLHLVFVRSDGAGCDVDAISLAHNIVATQIVERDA